MILAAQAARLAPLAGGLDTLRRQGRSRGKRIEHRPEPVARGCCQGPNVGSERHFLDVAAQDDITAVGIPLATLPITPDPLRIENSPAGPVELKVRVPGFREHLVRDVQLAAGKVTEVKVTLEPEDKPPPKVEPVPAAKPKPAEPG